MDSFGELIDEDDEDIEEEKPIQDEEFDEINKWIDEHKQVLNDKFYYILSSDIKDCRICDALISQGWRFTTALSYSFRKRGYKIEIH